MHNALNTAQIQRKIDNLIRIGLVTETDPTNHQIRVQSGGILTDWLPMPAQITNNSIAWHPIRVGTQVVLACPEGSPELAVIIAMLYTDNLNTTETDPQTEKIQFTDGTSLSYNTATSVLSVNASGDIRIEIAGNAEINASGNASITASQIKMNDGKPVVTTGHICAFTGNPHSHGSSSVIAAE